MNALIQGLAEVCRETQLREKWLLVPSLRVGRQWLDGVAWQKTPVVNVRLKTLSRIARELAMPCLIREGCSFLSPIGGVVLIERIWNRRPDASGYLRSLTPGTNLFQNLFTSLQAIRMAGLCADELTPEPFESADKAREIQVLLSDYQEALEKHRLADRADCFREAITALQNETDSLPADCLFLIPDDMECAGLERWFLDCFPQERIVRLPVDEPIDSASGSFIPQTGLDTLRWLTAPSDAPPPIDDGSVTLFHAVGETNEIREVFRRCLADRIPLDEVELLYTDTETYLPIVYELSQALQKDQPVTFAEGIPVRYSRPGRAFTAWMRWIASDFPQSAMLEMLRDRLLEIPGITSSERVASELAQSFREIPIGFGRERYTTKTGERLQTLEKRKESCTDSENGDDDAKRRHLEMKYKKTADLESFLTCLLADTPDRNSTPRRILECARRFLKEYARCVTELDNNFRNAMISQFDEIERWLEWEEGSLSFDIFRWLQSILDQKKLLGSGPRPGCLHASRWDQGGHSGRKHTFIVGLDDSRFPGAGLQDSILLDHERARLSPELPTASARQHKKLEDFYRLLCRLRGTVRLSFSSMNVCEDREMFPSMVYLSAFRILTGNPSGDHSVLMDWLSQPTSFAPSRRDACLNESEWWLACMANGDEGRNPLDAVLKRYPHLESGMKARQSRASNEFTVYDGWVQSAGKSLDPTLPAGPVLSATTLELLGKCPLAYFFRYGLLLEPPDDLEIDPNRWLNPMEFGLLMHDLFERFMERLIESKQQANDERHWPLLSEMLEEMLSKKRLEIPPPNENAYRLQAGQLRRCASIFLKDEERLSEDYTPLYVEAAIGLESGGESAPLDTPEPVEVNLPEGLTFRAKGIIDRIDRLGDESDQTYAIWDYKSGGTYKFKNPKKPDEPFRQGRVIQHRLYLDLAEKCLREKIAPNARLAQFGYFFPSAKGQGERMTWTPEELTQGKNVLFDLCQIVRHGAFCPTNNESDCTFCDCASICRDPKTVAAGSQLKLENPMNRPLLEPLMRLRIDERKK